MRLVTWNINSVRLRLPLIEKLTAQVSPDVLCLQETKVTDELFPVDALKALGYEHMVFRGEKSYNGVAILSRLPLHSEEKMDIAGAPDARHISTRLPGDIELHNFYIPAGGDEPDTTINPKYKFKLEFVEYMTRWFAQNRNPNDRVVAVGDFNIAPLEHDVWSHKQLRNVVSHTEPEITRLDSLKKTLDWVDVARHFVPEEEKLYSWWSYRNRDWRTSNRGRRLDHVWVTPALQNALQSHEVIADARDWEKPSDHVPVVVEIKG